MNAPALVFPNSDIISGLRFCATMQLRTPLRVLRRHGELFFDLPNEPPHIARAQWEGIWTSQTHSFRELGIELDEHPAAQMASSIGPIPFDGGDYLKFLIAVREIVELANSIEDRLARLYIEVSKSQWTQFGHACKLSPHSIGEYFFPYFVSTITGLTVASTNSMKIMGLSTPAAIDDVPDDVLLGINGIGPAKLRFVRTRCAEIVIDRHHDRIDMVKR